LIGSTIGLAANSHDDIWIGLGAVLKMGTTGNSVIGSAKP
jgi:hypothetical protein